MEFKDRLRMLRTERKLSTTEFGAVFGRSDGAVRMWETGRSKPDVDTLIELATFFDCSVDYLLGVTDFPDSLQEGFYSNFLQELEKELEKTSYYYRTDLISCFMSIVETWNTFEKGKKTVYINYGGFINDVLVKTNEFIKESVVFFDEHPPQEEKNDSTQIYNNTTLLLTSLALERSTSNTIRNLYGNISEELLENYSLPSHILEVLDYT